MVSQITPEEFRWQDANYDRDSALGRELLFLIADNGWSRATSEKISVTRSDSLETSIEIDIDLDRITHEAFRGRTGRIWLPILVLPPLRQSAESDPQSALTVMDAAGTPRATLADADITHRIDDRDLPANTVISVGLVKTPDLDTAAGPWTGIKNSDTDAGYIRRAG